MNTDKRSKRVSDIAEYAVLQQESILGLTEIGNINFTDFNDARLGVTEIDVVFEDAKPDGFYLDRVLFKNTEEFESESYGYYVSGEIESITLKSTTPPSIDILGSVIPAVITEDITIMVVLTSENSKDFIAGNIKVYALLKAHPLS